MRTSHLEGKLTAAARQALDGLVTEYREQVLTLAAQSAARLGEVQEISVHDIVEGHSRAQAAGDVWPLRSLVLATRVYSVLGALAALGAFLVALSGGHIVGFAFGGLVFDLDLRGLVQLIGFEVCAFGLSRNTHPDDQGCGAHSHRHKKSNRRDRFADAKSPIDPPHTTYVHLPSPRG